MMFKLFIPLMLQMALTVKSSSVISNDKFEFIDLSHSFDKNSIYWPNALNFSFVNVETRTEKDGSWYASNDFCAGEHGGTHLDAPYHFSRLGKFADQIPLSNLIVPLIMADISDKVADDPNFILRKHHLDDNLKTYLDDVKGPCLILFKFGWSKFYSNRHQYLGIDEERKTLNFPGLSSEVAQWLVSSHKNVVGVGLDVASVDPGASLDFMAHKILLGAGVYVLENVQLNQYVPETQCTALVMPVKIARGTGAPLRLVALCPRDRILQTTTSSNNIEL